MLIEEPHGAASGYFCTATGDTYAVHITADSLDACPALGLKIAGHEEAIEQRLRRAGSDHQAFLSELSELLTSQPSVAAASSSQQPLPPVAYYERIVAELDAVGWGSLAGVNPTLDELQLRVDDAAGRGHVLGLALPPDYPRSPPRVTTAALPGTAPFELAWPSSDASSSDASSATSGAASLAGALSQFRAALARHQLLWDMLDDLDAHAWVLEPKNPARDCVSRRVALGDHCSLQLELHVGAPASLPELQFYGADRVIAPLRQALNANLARWQPERSVRLNLAAVLGKELPAPAQAAGGVGGAAAEEYATECAICYLYELDGAVPECACDSCSKPFHKACLSEWLRGLPTTQQSFNRLFGECPYCGTSIAVEASGGAGR